MATHRYWRITVTQSTSGATNTVSLYEVEMRGVVDGADQCNGGTASASHNDSTSYKLFENNTSEYWSNGAPSTTCWFQYDFASGDVEIKQLLFIPRYSSQSPKDFTISSSDNGIDWSEEAAWSGMTDWTGGVGKTIDIPGPIVKVQLQQPFDLTLATKNLQPVPLGVFIDSWLTAPFSAPNLKSNSHPFQLTITKETTSPYSPTVETNKQHNYGISISHDQQQPYKRWLMSHSNQPIYGRLSRKQLKEWSLREMVTAQISRPFTQTYPIVAKASRQADLLLHNPVTKSQYYFWDLADSSNLQHISQPEIKIDGLVANIVNLSIEASQEQAGWRLEMDLADDCSWQNLNINTLFNLEIAGELFLLLVDSKNSSRDGSGRHQRTLIASSPIVKYDTPRAATINLVSRDSCGAKELVEELLGETVLWQQVNWTITAGVLSYNGQTPLQVVKNIVSSVGGVVNSKPDGTVLIQPRFPIPVSEWQIQTPNHVLTDSSDNLEINESCQTLNLFDKVTILNQKPDQNTGFLTIDLDRREDGPNRGKSRFKPGDTTHLLLTTGPDTLASTITPSAANVINTGETTYPVTEILAFINNNQAKLSQPIQQIEQFVWLGTDLGNPKLEQDGQTVTTATEGVAMLKITGTTTSRGYQFSAPQQLEGMASFPVVFSCSGETTLPADRSVTRERNNGRRPAPDIFAPLLSGKPALIARCEQELDLGEELQIVDITSIYRPGLAPGQLIEIHDTLYGRSFRGILTALCHTIGQNTPTSKLTISKK
ncbi:MAG: discoidin domain-containing protein [Magnetococcales bacterium]|nr:discoidin domain-containing protein [Magnetococcales bacterium]